MPAAFTTADAAAVRLLLGQRVRGLRFDVTNFSYDMRIVFDTFSNYCAATRTALPELALYSGLRDGCTLIRKTADGPQCVVLYNEKIASTGRRRFTLAHEIGHIVLAHDDDSPAHEKEADRFAAQLLLPRVLVWELLIQKQFALSSSELAEIFGVSRLAAANRLKSLRRNNPPVFSPDERKLLKKLGGLLPLGDDPIVDF